MEKNISRRSILKSSAGILSVAGFSISHYLYAAACEVLTTTPQQTSGPFYPETDVLKGNNDNDLTRVHGRSAMAKGIVVYIEGKVQDKNCNPIPGALVDIWQANHEGRYHHSLDSSNPKPLDPNFQSRGISISDSDGRYTFKTIIPGAYPADASWMRPSHIHFRVSKLGFRELTTQLYFKGSQYLEQDKILQSLSAEEQAAVVVDFSERTLANGEKIKLGNFSIVLEKLAH